MALPVPHCTVVPASNIFEAKELWPSLAFYDNFFSLSLTIYSIWFFFIASVSPVIADSSISN